MLQFALLSLSARTSLHSSTSPLRTDTESALIQLTFSIRSTQANSAQNLPACLSTRGKEFQTLGKPRASRTEVCSPRPEASFPAHPHRYAPRENSHQLGIHKTLLRSSNVQYTTSFAFPAPSSLSTPPRASSRTPLESSSQSAHGHGVATGNNSRCKART